MRVGLRLNLALGLWLGTSIVACSSSDQGNPSGAAGNGWDASVGRDGSSDSGGLQSEGGTGTGGGMGGVGGALEGGPATATDGSRDSSDGWDGSSGSDASPANPTPDAASPGADGGNASDADSGLASSIVWQWGQEGHEDALAAHDWLVDNAQGKREGANAVHAPALKVGVPADLTIDCGGQAHTELTFYVYRKESEGSLDLLVDGVQRQTISGWTSAWKKYVFVAPLGAHTYTFRAASESDLPASFVLDSFTCSRPTPTASGGTVDFDRGFVPPEIGGAWIIDNAQITYNDGSDTESEASIHPPAIKANSSVEMTFDCGQAAHTELSFYLSQPGSGTLNLLVDGVQRQSVGSSANAWKKYVFDVPQGSHVYTFRAESESDAPTSFILDFLQCKNVTPAVASNLTVDFDQAYIPPEIGGVWLVDNAVWSTYEDGSKTTTEAAIHPPAMKANTTADMTFDCGAHTELSFYLSKPGSGTLDLLVDGVQRQTLNANPSAWRKYVFDVPQGSHVYTFRARTTSDAATSFLVDFLQCKNVNPVVASNATVDFDQAYIPPETGGVWLVDNAVWSTYNDGSETTAEAAIHPPALRANTAADMTFDCGQAAHTELSFYLSKPGSGTLELLVDGTSNQMLTANPNAWKKYTIAVAQGKHAYTFRAQSTTDSPDSFLVDFLQCKQ